MKDLGTRWVLLIVFLVAAPFLCIGLTWGLPSHAADRFLFGNHHPWSGQKLLDLAGGWDSDASIGADVARNPITTRNQPVLLNDSDIDRARIIRRYRLYSEQPDEMITFRALARMNPRHLRFDPALYQYGGLWIYPVAILLRAAATLHLVTLRGDLAWYLDHPEAFARFYIVARAYSLAWGLLGIAVVFKLARKLCGGLLIPASAALCFATMPVIVNAAHEAKPHLAGSVLILLSVLAASSYVQRGRRREALIAGGLCGGAVGMVLWAYPVFLILPLMTLLRPAPTRHRLKVTLAAIAVGLGVYLLSNPFVPWNLIFDRALIRSNFANNLANGAVMYHRGEGNALPNAAWLAIAGTSPLLFLAGLIGTFFLAIRAAWMIRRADQVQVRDRAAGVLLGAVALAMAIPFALFAAGKPGEYGRFAIVPDIFLLLEATVAIGTFIRPFALRGVLAALLVAATLLSGASYTSAFARDSNGQTSRQSAALRLQKFQHDGATRLAVFAEPAPYAVPPVDLFDWQVVLAPVNSEGEELPGGADVSVRALDMLPAAMSGRGPLANLKRLILSTPLSWANKHFAIKSAP